MLGYLPLDLVLSQSFFSDSEGLFDHFALHVYDFEAFLGEGEIVY
jgi:hypothetical protein